MSGHQPRVDRRPGQVRCWPAQVAWVAGVCAALAAFVSAIAHANVLVGLLLLGVAYLLSRFRFETAAPRPWRYFPPLTIVLISIAAIYIVVADFLVSSSSN